jgi:hypothetical protein
MEKLLSIGEPDELAVKFEVKSNAAAVEIEEEILSPAGDRLDAATSCYASEEGRGLRFYGDGMEDVNAANAAALREWAKGASDGFYLWQFRHSERNTVTKRA